VDPEISQSGTDRGSGSSCAQPAAANRRAAHELEIESGKVARDHVHLFLWYRPKQQAMAEGNQLAGAVAGVSSLCARNSGGRHLWARGYFAVSSGTITDEMIREYIDEQEGRQIIDDSRFPIDNP
jgi:putative transposase